MLQNAGAACERDATASERTFLARLAERFGTPLHVLCGDTLRARIDALMRAMEGMNALACYAVKANGNRAILARMAAAGLGADIVSGGELRRALDAGVPAGRIVFSGVGKTTDEIDAALAAGIARFNVESFDELQLLQHLAVKRRMVAHASVRVNPDVDARTHEKISTGRAGDKFGVEFDEARRWFATSTERPNVRLDGLHVHIGSQLLDVAPFREAYARVAGLWRELASAGHAIGCIDVGGGLGVQYRTAGDHAIPACAQVDAAREAFAGFDGRFVFEPGRWLVAEAGFLLARVVRTKRAGGRDFVVLDAGMNDLARPSLYDAWHEIETLHGRAGRRIACDVVGPVCETGDIFARGRELSECRADDLVRIRTTGAYGASMASTYNSRPLAAEVLVEDGRCALVRRRQSLEAMVADELQHEEWITP